MIRKQALFFLVLALSLSAATALATERKGSGPAEKEAAQAAIATGDYEVPGVEVALLSVKRVSDGTLTVKWEYRNTTDQPKRLGESFKGMGWSEPFSLVYDAYLVDAKNRMKYPVVKDTRGDLVAGKHPGRSKVVVLGPKKTLGTWAKFMAVPASVKTISVFIPGTQPFEDVAIGD
ncbi:MAG: hypothetical protein ACM3JH_02495 [Acidithiobacillales bacterium]